MDKQVIRLMRDRTEGNTMAKLWRQVQESHCEEYLHRKDLYTTLLSQYNKPGKITSKSDLNFLFFFLQWQRLKSKYECSVSFPSAVLNQVNKIQQEPSLEQE